MRKFLNHVLGFSRKEYQGIVVLIFLIIVVMLVPYVYKQFSKPGPVYDKQFAKDMQEVLHAEKVSRRKVNYDDYSGGDRRNRSYYLFDPNNLPVAGWKKLGLSERQIRVIKNYEAKGGRFYKPEDLSKIYSISAGEYERLKPFIRIQARTKDSTGNSYQREAFASVSRAKASVAVELNSADSAVLLSVKGIGPAFASRIIKYRNRLGGFHTKEQLREVYGIDSARYQSLSTQVRIDVASIKKINVNTATAADFNRHPYLSYKQINAIVQYRQQHGAYGSIADLKKIPILGEEILRKIEPYLTF